MADIPAGWHKDANGVTRWWDGTQWTEHTQPDSPVPSTVQLGKPAGPPAQPPVGSTPYAAETSSNRTAWLVVGGIGLAVLVLIGGVIGLVVVAAHKASDTISAAEESIGAAQSDVDEAEVSDEPSAAATLGDYVLPSRTPGAYPTDDYGITSPSATDVSGAPKDADKAKFCQIAIAPPSGGQEDYWERIRWEQAWLGTPSDMPDDARKGWEAIVSDEVQSTDAETSAEVDYERDAC